MKRDEKGRFRNGDFKMNKPNQYFFFLVLSVSLILSGSLSSAEEFGYGETEEIPINYSDIVINETANVSNYWSTNDGYLDGIDTDMLNNDAGLLTVVKSWWDNLYCQLTGCTMAGDIDMDGNDILNISDIYFNLNNCITDGTYEGRICWDEDKNTISIDSGLGTVLQVGQEMTRATRNLAGETIYAGQVVYIFGSQGERETVKLADASDGSTLHNLAMVTQDSCNFNAECQVTMLGLVHDIDTSGFTEGDTLYLSADGSGNVTLTQPNFPNYNIHLGKVLRSHTETGMIAFYPEVDWGDGVTLNSLGILTNLTVLDSINANWSNSNISIYDLIDVSDSAQDLYFLQWNDTAGEWQPVYIGTTYYNATTANLVAGTLDGGSLNDTKHSSGNYDGVSMNISEQAGSPGLDIIINFTDIESFQQGIVRYKTSVIAGALPTFYIYDYDDADWEPYQDAIESEEYRVSEVSVFDDDAHISPTGVVQVRLYKPENGNINNHYYFDWLAIAEGFGVPAGEEIDPLSIHKDGTVPLTGNWNYGSYNINGSGNFTSTGSMNIGSNTLSVNEVSGNVGIGTASPSDLLVVSEGGNGGEIRFGGGNGRTLSAYNGGSLSNFDFTAVQTYFKSDFLIAGGKKISTANGVNDNLYLTTTNSSYGLYTDRNVGIGTSSPGANLHIYPNSGNDQLTILEAKDTGQTRINFLETGGTSFALGVRGVTDKFVISTGSSLTSDEKLVIDTAGNVGIGTTSPQNKLDVAGAQVIGSSYAGTNTAPTDGLLVEGNVGIGTTSPSYKFSVGSTDATDQIGIYHDNSNAYMKWNDGILFFQTDEGTNTNTKAVFQGKGTGYGEIVVKDSGTGDTVEWYVNSGNMYFNSKGTTQMYFDTTNENNINFWPFASDGITKELQIYGYRTGDSKRSLEIGVGVDAADTASFDGVSNYYFDGNVNAINYSVGGTAGFTGSCVNVTYSGGLAVSCND